MATFLRRSVQEHCPPGSINWAKLCDPSSWLEEEEEEKPPAVVAASPVATVATVAPAETVAPAAEAKGKGKGKVKVKAKPKPRAPGRSSHWPCR